MSRCGWFGEGKGQCILHDNHRGEHAFEGSTHKLIDRLRRLKVYGACQEAAAHINLDQTAAEALGYRSASEAMNSMYAIIRQTSRDTFGKEMMPKEYADESGYDS